LFYGKCLAIVQTNGKAGNITLKASVDGFPAQQVVITGK